MSNLQKYNPNIKFLLIVIDTFSRYLWVEPIKDKKAKTVVDAFRRVLQKGRKPEWVRADHGSEFNNRWLKDFLKSKGTGIFFTFNETKANYAERVIRTLKTVMFRYFTHNQTYKYEDKLQDFVYDYNNRPHRSLNERSPSEISKSNEDIVWKEQYMDTLTPSTARKTKRKSTKRFNFKIGDLVRLSHLRKIFDRDYQEKWTEELFKIDSRKLIQNIPIYTVVDFDNDPIKGSFYENELQRVRKTDDHLYRVERVMKRRTRNGQKEVLVKWQGWPSKFNSWILESSLEDI